MNAGTICSREVECVHPTCPARDAAERMRNRHVGTLVVVEESRAPTGIVTDRDLVVRVLADGLDPHKVTMRALMTSLPAVVSEGSSLEEALELMAENKVRRLPVVGMDGRLVGILTLDDIVSNLSSALSLAGKVLRQWMHPAARTRPLDADPV